VSQKERIFRVALRFLQKK